MIIRSFVTLGGVYPMLTRRITAGFNQLATSLKNQPLYPQRFFQLQKRFSTAVFKPVLTNIPPQVH
jgi:hypothetical protein